ncbi:uncharacterized protein DEA37_0004830 [Paragonimus westermani]|uniref:Transcription initiation factor TFIIA large subunit n=1 Tax=Paragonimus westermani TaxID=34504 RepID=A0A5J4NEV2_9TREM|nr:uncharacterized protein DEA37_0004830 [Paragonimus westermani]
MPSTFQLWTTKLSETHVFDPEPSTNSAAQYLSLIQRSHLQIRPSGAVNLGNTNISLPVRQLVSTGRVVVSSGGPGATIETAPHTMGSFTNIRPSIVRPVDQLSTQPGGLQLNHSQRLPQHTLVHAVPGVLTANTTGATHIHAPHQQQPRAVVPAALQTGVAPQIAALPSGLTGHLVQIGQQTYLVPQSLVGIRQPGTSQLSISQIVGASGPTALTTDTVNFHQTQVDGGQDSEDKFCDTPISNQPTPGVSIHHHSNRPGTDRSLDLEDEDEDDDDDFVAATPGSVRSHYPHHRGMNTTDATNRDTPSGATLLMSGPPTPMTPPSAASRTPFSTTPGWRRPAPPTAGRQPNTPGGRKRRRRSSFNAGDTDTEADDYDDVDDGYDVGEDVELMTNATMTPAGHGAELDEDEEDGAAVRRGRSPQRRPKRSGAPHTGPGESTPQQVLSPGSQLGDMPPELKEHSGEDHELPHGDEDEEEAEEDEEPLNSGDDVSDEEPEVLFESDNVVVCQYDKIHRSRNRWRFHLKDGIMAINGRDHVFQKAVGEAEW